LLKKSNPSIDITIYELRETPTTLGLAINVTCNGLRVFNALGIYKELLEECVETPTFECYNAQGKYFGTVRGGSYTKEKYGYGTMRILRTVMHSKILRRLGEENITLKWGMNLTKIDETAEEVQCIFSDGTKDTCDMLVGADGVHSVVRSLRVDPTWEPRYTGLSSVGSNVTIKDVKSPLYFTGNFGTVWTKRGMFAT
jgi:2-polyprenyl-6-methoxyphenol hydroxylase-like FAD-dependent oxidoreductase